MQVGSNVLKGCFVADGINANLFSRRHGMAVCPQECTAANQSLRDGAVPRGSGIETESPGSELSTFEQGAGVPVKSERIQFFS